MPRRGSIRRWMIVMALIGLGLANARDWSGPQNFFGEITPMALLANLGVITAVLGTGRIRRFGLGTAVAGLLIAILFLCSFSELRAMVQRELVIPIERRIFPVQVSVWTEAMLSPYGTKPGEDLGADHWYPIAGCQAQGILGLIELPMALAVGFLISARWRDKQAEPNSPRTDRVDLP